MPGVYAPIGRRRTTNVQGAASPFLTAVVAAQYIGAATCPFFSARIVSVSARALVAGTGAGNTVLDIRINGVSAYTTTANRPTLLATSTGAFANTLPDTVLVRAGDAVDIQVLSISTTGHAGVAANVLLEEI